MGDQIDGQRAKNATPNGLDGDEYVCECCGGRFTRLRDDHEAKEEAKQEYGANVFEEEEMALVCTDCNRKVTKWAKARGLT